MNKTLNSAAKEILKNLLVQCTEQQQLMFKRMYCHENLNATIDEAIEQMDENKIDWAITQVERTIEKNSLKI